MTGLEPEEPAAAPTEQLTDRRSRRAARREARWTGPQAPRDWRYWVGGTGRVFIITGMLMFGFVAYQLWGTGIEYARAQNELDDEFEELLASATTTTVVATTSTTEPDAAPTTTTGPTTTTTTVPVPVPVPVFADGDALAQLQIPDIGVDTKVVSGVSPSDLQKGPGHYKDTPMPGQLGNSAIAGHRTTWGQPFFRLDELDPGNQIVVTTIQGRFVYLVTGSEVVGPGDSDVVATTDPTTATLTLTTCDPKYTARNRLIIYADLDTDESGPGLPPVVDDDAASTATLPGETPETTTATTPGTFPGDDPTVTSAPPPATTEPVAVIPADDDGDDEVADAFAHGWFSDGAAWPQVALWGVVTALVAIAGLLTARRFRRYWVGAVAVVLPFVVTLYFFYQNVNRLLPAAL